ncbi:hypothetical protein E1264_18625 [Actinomadura sp. KC216]|uniref:hypothetical protein n=1 Tax=Actinomadura sp. KC216 TaxID=2530370 RepID=UPI001051A646|nr:hypothetical protein [Actinomadura sp. KC216]TDB86234.1 hypothetical protein E1264_18625 [Actinomadura sp. KC216]
MRRSQVAARRRSGRSLLWLAPLIVVVVAAGAVIMAARQSPITPDGTPVTIADMLKDYRGNPGPRRSDIGGPEKLPFKPAKDLKGFAVPAAGIYTYATTGKDWIELNGKEYTRPFPTTTYASVHQAGGCVWEMYFRPIAEHTDAHRQCSAPGEYLCLAHMQKVEFAGIEADESHRCHPGPMIQVGGKASKPGGVEETVCHAEDNSARIVIKYLATEPITVGGEKRNAHHMRIDSYIKGDDINGTAVADVWFDTKDGMYLKMVRIGDIRATVSGETGHYKINATYTLQSLKPQV